MQTQGVGREPKGKRRHETKGEAAKEMLLNEDKKSHHLEELRGRERQGGSSQQ